MQEVQANSLEEEKICNKRRRIEYEFSLGTRWTHWIRAFAIFVLTFTGFYLAYVFISPNPSDVPIGFLNAEFRMWHEIFGFVLIAVSLFKGYLFFIDKESRKERVAFWDVVNPIIWAKQIRYYLFLGEHPHLRGAYNPLQFVAYIGLYVMVFIICLTGVMLYVHVYHDGLGALLYPLMRPLEVMMGGLSMVRQIHHITMWGILLFVPVHIYMAIFNSIMGREGAIDAIVSGYKFGKPNCKKKKKKK